MIIELEAYRLLREDINIILQRRGYNPEHLKLVKIGWVYVKDGNEFFLGKTSKDVLASIL